MGSAAVVTAIPLFLVDWSVPQLTAFVAAVLILRGALHVVTTSFEGAPGALSALWVVASSSPLCS